MLSTTPVQRSLEDVNVIVVSSEFRSLHPISPFCVRLTPPLKRQHPVLHSPFSAGEIVDFYAHISDECRRRLATNIYTQRLFRLADSPGVCGQLHNTGRRFPRDASSADHGTSPHKPHITRTLIGVNRSCIVSKDVAPGPCSDSLCHVAYI